MTYADDAARYADEARRLAPICERYALELLLTDADDADSRADGADRRAVLLEELSTLARRRDVLDAAASVARYRAAVWDGDGRPDVATPTRAPWAGF